jgi:hypothetical protein
LSDFGIARPSALLGAIHFDDEAVLHALLWGTAASEGSATGA